MILSFNWLNYGFFCLHNVFFNFSVIDNICIRSCMYVYIYSSDLDIQKYTVTMKIIIYSVKISSPIGTISNSEVVDLQ